MEIVDIDHLYIHGHSLSNQCKTLVTFFKTLTLGYGVYVCDVKREAVRPVFGIEGSNKIRVCLEGILN